MAVDNPNPVVHAVQKSERKPSTPARPASSSAEDEDTREPFCAGELFDLIRDIIDPEHPYTLEQLKVVRSTHAPTLTRPRSKASRSLAVAAVFLRVWGGLVLAEDIAKEPACGPFTDPTPEARPNCTGRFRSCRAAGGGSTTR
jgi:hypothetical protein